MQRFYTQDSYEAEIGLDIPINVTLPHSEDDYPQLCSEVRVFRLTKEDVYKLIK